MKLLIGAIAAAAVLSIALTPARAQSFSCMELDGKAAAEIRICSKPELGALDERLDSWYRRALERAQYFDQTGQVRAEQRAWLVRRNACGAATGCLRRAYKARIETLRNYVEHV